jgi:glycosyltransferase involved in cell wall biosynthesis
VHCHSSKAGLLARFAASGLGARVVYTPHAIYTMSPNLSPRMRQLYQTAEVTLSWLTDKIIAVSRAEFEECRRLGIRDTRLALVPNTVGEPNCLPREAARQQIGLRDEEVAIDCFARVPAEAPARLVVIGDGELASAARRQAETLGIDAKVLWLGARPAEPLLRAFDIFAMPSRYEAASYSLLEAMAAGLPVITTATGSASDLILDGRNGYCVPVEDVDRFGACLATLVTDGAQREAMAEAARQPRRETAGVQQMVEDILSVYAAARPSRPSWRTATIDAT